MRRFRSLPLLLLPLLSLQAADSPGEGMNRFAIEAYRECARGSGNLVLSPFSNASALSMLLDGAHGETATQIARVLHQPFPDPGRYSAVSGLLDQLTRHGNAEDSQLLTAHGLWIQRGFAIRGDYERMLVQYYHASVTQYDFAGNPEQARVAINFWTAQQTRGKIQDLFTPGSLPRDTRMVLTSAIYFHGLWQSPFSYEQTRPAPFHSRPGDAGKVETMNLTAPFGYAETPAVQLLEMKYGRSPLVFDILLPRTAEGLSALEVCLTPEKLSAFWNSLGSRNVSLALPRFHLESDVSLRDGLSRLGITDAFSGRADFSGIDDKRDLVLSDLRHKAFIEVAEEGTTAAAVTGGTARLVSTAQPPPTVFRADHPFLFLIRDTHTGVILFMGRMVKPGV